LNPSRPQLLLEMLPQLLLLKQLWQLVILLLLPVAGPVSKPSEASRH
jgi:hypothetical protein